jgi:hypothetical protein
MKKYLVLLFMILVLFVSCAEEKPQPEHKALYKNGDYVYFTQPGENKVDTLSGENKVDTLFGQIDMGIFEPMVYTDSTFVYRITYKMNGKIEHKMVYDAVTIIGKKK